MAGPSVELFRFALYVGFPIALMFVVGDPEYYNRWVYPLRDAYLQPEKADVKLSETPSELKEQLAMLKQQRLERRARTTQGQTSSSHSPLDNAETPRLV